MRRTGGRFVALLWRITYVILDRVMMKVMKEDPQMPYLYYSGFILKP